MEDFQFDLTIPGDPKPKGRPRFTRYGKSYTPKQTVDAENEIARMAGEICPRPLTVPCCVEAIFYCKTRRRTDGDNLFKLVLDALSGVAYTDDYLVEEGRYRIYRAAEGEDPRTEVVVSALD